MTVSRVLGVALPLLFLTGCPRTGWHPADVPEPPPEGPFDMAMNPFVPEIGPLVTQADPPPPLSGGTLLVLADGKVVAADPDRDTVFIVDPDGAEVVRPVALSAHDEPGRAVEDGAGRVHVALRRGGALVTINPAAAKVIERRAVCPAPRGVAWQKAGDLVHVACAGGELVSLPAAGGPAGRVLRLDRDLRDVVVDGDKLLVSRLRTAEVLVVGADGALVDRMRPPPGPNGRLPQVAWRMIPRPGGGVLLLHQRGLTGPIDVQKPGGYGGTDPCNDPIVDTTVTEMVPGQTPVVAPTLALAVVAVDVARTFDGRLALAAAGNMNSHVLQQVPAYDAVETHVAGCLFPTGGLIPSGEVTAVAVRNGRIVAQRREPASIIVDNRVIDLSTVSRADTGHTLFHVNAGAFLACASCHPEGGDDAHVWTFSGLGARRTQTIRGGILGTEPFHWGGDMHDFTRLAEEVFVKRMSGPSLARPYVDALAAWIDRIPDLPPSAAADPAAAARGRDIFFQDEKAGCVMCHSGPRYTNNLSTDVGTGELLQVPSLVGVAQRTPLMHTGCAGTLRERFTNPACGGGDLHGKTSHLSSSQIDDLVAFLETL